MNFDVPLQHVQQVYWWHKLEKKTHSLPLPHFNSTFSSHSPEENNRKPSPSTLFTAPRALRHVAFFGQALAAAEGGDLGSRLR